MYTNKTIHKHIEVKKQNRYNIHVYLVYEYTNVYIIVHINVYVCIFREREKERV